MEKISTDFKNLWISFLNFSLHEKFKFTIIVNTNVFYNTNFIGDEI